MTAFTEEITAISLTADHTTNHGSCLDSFVRARQPGVFTAKRTEISVGLV